MSPTHERAPCQARFAGAFAWVPLCAVFVLAVFVLALFACLSPVATSPHDRPTGGTVVVRPAAVRLSIGDTVQLIATLTESSGTVLGGLPVTWTSSAPDVATVDQAGLVTAMASGTATITASIAGAESGTATIFIPAPNLPGTVNDLAVAVVTDSSITLRFTEVDDGTGRPARYDVRFAPGTTLTWGPSAPSVRQGTCATPVVGTAIGAKRTCTVLALEAGSPYSFQLVAFRGTLNANAVFGGLSSIVTDTTAGSTAPVASVTVRPESLTLLVGGTRQLQATLRDAKGNVVTERPIAWTSTAPAVATVSATGLVTAQALGSATIVATSEGHGDSVLTSVVASLPPVTYYRTDFSDGTTGPLDVYTYGGGSCVSSTDYRDSASAHSMKCTIPGGTGAAALQAWFGNGRLADLPPDPSLDQDLFQEVRFVLAPGALLAIGGTCTPAGWKVHKSVYGQAGSAWNGWVMSMESCAKGIGGLYSEAEMWTIDGKEYRWPGTEVSVNEGKVYDVVYRYHRYTAENCGTIAIWVNGTNVMDSPCWTYMGTTNGSGRGLLFWDGATYLQDGLGPFSVYTLFTQATNFPIGPATASP